MSTLTPMMQQFREIKNQHPDTIVLFRLGDFYEMFFEDALIASRELELVLTGREGGEVGRVPMCGFPHHAANSYINRLINKGFRVAICEQVEDPRTARGLVKREVVRIVTPGTVIDGAVLNEKANNFLLAAVIENPHHPRKQPAAGLAVADASTGEFRVTEFSGSGAVEKLISEIGRIDPSEVLLSPKDWAEENLEQLRNLSSAVLTAFLDLSELSSQEASEELKQHFRLASLEGLGLAEMPMAVTAAAGLLRFLQQTQKAKPINLKYPRPYRLHQYLTMDLATRRNLELTSSLRHGSREGSLLMVLDHTITAAGGRMLRHWLEHPLINVTAIKERLDAVERLVEAFFFRTRLREILQEVYDLERIMARITYGTTNARDLIALKKSLQVVPEVKKLLQEEGSGIGRLEFLEQQLDELPELVGLLEKALVDNPPATLREGGLIREGYHPEVDRLRQAAAGGKEWLASLEERERERTGIKSLKVGYNRVFGYYLEVTNPNLSLVPPDYIRKQTLANAERFITPELKEYEATILGAEDRLIELEYQLFTELRQQVAQEVRRIQQTAEALAELDVLGALAVAASENGYCKPVIEESLQLEIKDARHPVVEKLLDTPFVPNDVFLDGAGTSFALITGPNMGGKSTYCRSIALICIMAQIGSFVPAKAARIGLVDKIFARIGASDDLSGGQSTFMIEMNEVANIVNNATPRSLIILDEVGRGTSTFDGLSLAWALIEYLQRYVHARTLFATHYHELTDLEGVVPGLRNLSVAVKEEGGEIVFLRKVVEGKADRSYGLQVARLAGLPHELLSRAQEILEGLEKREEDLNVTVLKETRYRWTEMRGRRQRSALRSTAGMPRQLSLIPIENHPVLEEISKVDLVNTTPLEALNLIHEWQKLLRKAVEEC